MEYLALEDPKQLKELAGVTTCNSLLIAFLESRKILSETDVTILNSIEDRLKKSQTFYQLVVQRENSYSVLCEALKETNQTGALTILEKLNPIRFDVREPVHLFTGRDEELAKLHKHLNFGKNVATLVTHTASVTGLGGIGKTELCRKYIQKYSKDYDENVIWIGAEKPEMMENSFKTLAKDVLNISLKDADGGEKDIKTVVDEVYNYFHEKKCLFVFDNAVSINDEQLSIFLPVRVSKRPHLLITSRDRDWELPMNVLELEELKEHEAIQFVKKGLSIQDNDQGKSIIALVTKLQRFPLALQQAISFITQQRSIKTFQIDEYLTLFEVESKLLLSHQTSAFLTNKYAQTTFTTWKITTDVIAADKHSGNLAMCYLNMISYLEPDKIPSELLLKHEKIDEDEMHTALQILVKYSMLSCQPSEGLFNVHRLVQEVTRVELRSFKKEEETLRKCLLLIDPKSVDKETVSHAMSAFDFALDYQMLVANFSSFPWGIMAHLDQTSRYKEALKFGRKSVGALRLHLPPNSLELARAEAMLGKGEFRHRNHDGFRNNLDNLDRILGQYNTSNLNAHQTLTLCVKAFKLQLMDAGKKSSSLKLLKNKKSLEEIIQILKSLNLEDMKDVPWETKEFTLQILAEHFADIGEHQEALLRYQMILENKTKFLGENDITELPALMMNVAEMQFWTGDKETSLSTAKSAYEKIKHLLDSDIQLLHIALRYAKILEDHDVSEALRISNEVYEGRKTGLGEEHADTLQALFQVGTLTTKAGHLEEAVKIFQNCSTLFREHFGERNDFTLEARTHLAMTLFRTESNAAALEIFKDVFNIYTEVKGGLNRSTLDTLYSIATILMVMYDFKGSLEKFVQLENVVVATCPKDDPWLMEIRERIHNLKTWISEDVSSQAGAGSCDTS